MNTRVVQLVVSRADPSRVASAIARAPDEFLPIENAIASRNDPFDQSTADELAQLPRDDLTNGAELLGQRLLCHADRDRRPAARFGPAEEKFDETCVDGSGGTIVEPVDEQADTGRKSSGNQKGKSRLLGDRGLELAAREKRATSCGGRDGGRRVHAPFNERNLRKRAAGAFRVDDVLPPTRASDDSDFALEHDEPSARLASGEEQDFVRREGDLSTAIGERLDERR